jgi:alpha-glucosidase (family GH31 glycosyl hydrolase)
MVWLVQSIYASDTGIPVMRSMVIEFPDDPTAPYLDKQ